jgi:AcrR family transcriptional regulator
MSMHTVDWSGLRPRTEPPTAEGLRERKKRLMRQRLSDTATAMFIERGFDAVRITEIAEACDVSEKTVFNYFPTKESLVLDLGESTLASLRADLADSALPPLQATLRILEQELGAMTSWLAAQEDQDEARALVLRFGMLIRSTPSLRAYQHDMTGRLVAAAADALARRCGLDAAEPEPQIAASALLGLWPIQFQALGRALKRGLTPEQVHAAVTADVERAARLLDDGLSSFASLSATAL